jgi:hypothetical protein
MTVKAPQKRFLKKTEIPKKKQKKPMTFFNPKTETDPDRSQKVNPAGLYCRASPGESRGKVYD